MAVMHSLSDAYFLEQATKGIQFKHIEGVIQKFRNKFVIAHRVLKPNYVQATAKVFLRTTKFYCPDLLKLEHRH